MSEFSNIPLTETNLRSLIRNEVQTLTNKTITSPVVSGVALNGTLTKAAVWTETKGAYTVENYNSNTGNLIAKKVTCDEIEVKNQPRLVFLNPGESFTWYGQGGTMEVVCRDMPPVPQPVLSVDSSVAWPMLAGFLIYRVASWIGKTYRRGCEIAKMEELFRERH